MFSRYIPLLADRCKKILFLPQKQLVPLFRDNQLGYDEIIDKFIPEKDMNPSEYFSIMKKILNLMFMFRF